MNSIHHRCIAEKSLTYLPKESFGYWSPRMELLQEASNFPDIFWPGENSRPEYLAKYPDWSDYTLVSLGNEKISCHSAFDPHRLFETYPPVLHFLISNAIESMEKGDGARAAKFAGVLSHVIGDTGQAAHVYDDAQLANLFMRDGESYLIHTFIENNPEVNYPAHLYSARPLGNTAEEL